MSDQATTKPRAGSKQSWPRKSLVVSWSLTAVAAIGFCIALALQSLGGVITTMLLLVAVGSVAIFLSLAELSVRSERRFRARNGLDFRDG